MASANGEIIARDEINGTRYEFRVAPITIEGKRRFQIEMRFRGSPWESALMGRYGSEKEALDNFVPRYRTMDLEGLEAIHPIIQQGKDKVFQQRDVEKREREHAEQVRLEAERLSKDRRDQIEGALSKASFKIQSAIPRGPEGLLPEVKGPSFGGLTVHKVGEGKLQRYQITHQKSGFAVGPEFQSQKDAKIAVFRLSQFADWNRDADEIRKTGLRFGQMLQRMQFDPYSDLADLAPEATIAETSVLDRINLIKEQQEKRRREILQKAPSGKELLNTDPSRLSEVWLFPAGKGAARTKRESNRLIEAALNVAEEADKVASSASHPAITTLNRLRDSMTDEEVQSFFKLLPKNALPFYHNIERDALIRAARIKAEREPGKALESVSLSQAQERFDGLSDRRKALDGARTAQNIAPAQADTDKEKRLQQRWLKNPSRLDFQGVDTKRAKPPLKPRMRRSKKL